VRRRLRYDDVVKNLRLADMPSQNGAAKALHDSELRFRMLFDHAAVGMCFVALDGTYVQTNRRLSMIVGYSAQELLNQTCVSLTHPDDRAIEKDLTAQMVAGTLSASTLEKRYVHKNGAAVWCSLTLTLLVDDVGAPYQFVGIVEDIDERRRSADKLRESESLLRLAGQTAHLGGWTYYYGSGEIVWSDEACAIFEVAAGAMPALAEALAFYRPGSIERIASAVEGSQQTGDGFDLELEIETALGAHRWVRVIGQAEPERGRFVRRRSSSDRSPIRALPIKRRGSIVPATRSSCATSTVRSRSGTRARNVCTDGRAWRCVGRRAVRHSSTTPAGRTT